MTVDAQMQVAIGTFDLDVELSAASDETLVVVGPNGAGKSTLLRVLAGLVALDSGRLIVDGIAWDDPTNNVFLRPEDRGIGMVFQGSALIPHLDARSNVAFGLRTRGVGRSAAFARAESLLEEMGLSGLNRRLPSQLSGGQCQRVALARAMACEPALLLLDEPLAAIDASTKTAMRSLLGQRDEQTRIIVTHDPIDALTLADRIVVVENGTVTQSGRPSDLINRPRSTYVAEIFGVNPLHGQLSGNQLDVGGMVLTVGAHTAEDGAVIAVIRPRAVSLHRHRPEGSPRNVWSTTIAGFELGADRVRVRLGSPLPLAVEITPAGLAALDLRNGDEVWASVKASEISVGEG